MAELLFIAPLELTQGTLVGGNVDPDKYEPIMLGVQDKVIQEMLGTELYDKIIADKIADTLTGDYLKIYTDFVKPVTKYETCAEFITLSPYVLNNGGLFKNNPDKAVQVEKEEKTTLSEWHHSQAMMYVDRFIKWIELNKVNIPEYKNIQDEVDASSKQNLNSGWYFND